MDFEEIYNQGYDLGRTVGRKNGYTGVSLNLFVDVYKEGYMEGYLRGYLAKHRNLRSEATKEKKGFNPLQDKKLDFNDASDIQPFFSDIFPDDIDENKLKRSWQIFDVIYDWDSKIRGIIIEKVSDNTFRVLWTNDVIGEVEEASENIYLVKNILNEINEEYDVNDAVAPCIEPDKFMPEKAIRIQIHISNPIVKTCVVRVVKDEEWFVATDEETKVTSQGKSIKEALINIKEALELYYSE